MGNVDSIPIVSQTKSLVQVIGGDADGAKRTQENFVRRAPVVSQVYSAGQAISGDADGARRTQLEFVQGVSDFADGVPVVGHVKGGIHYAVGDSKGGDNAMRSASRSTGVMAGAVAGTLAGGPAGGAAGAIAGGAAVDGIITGIESEINKEFTPSGLIASVDNNVKNPNDPGAWFDTAAIPVMDGVGGYMMGKSMQSKMNTNRTYRVMSEEHAKQAVQTKKLPPGQSTASPFFETCITEDINHSKAYLPQKHAANPGQKYTTVQMKTNKNWYNQMRNESIPQRGSKAINQQRYNSGQPIRNVWTQEKLQGTPHRNINIKG